MDWNNFKQLDGRFNTMKKALEIFAENKGEVIIETGTTRMRNDWGAGYSTVVFGEFLKHYGKGKLITVDIDEKNINFCKQVTYEYAKQIEYVLSDSLDFLKEYKGEIDFLYLDSYDYPDNVIASQFASNYREGWELALKQTDEDILKTSIDIVTPCQEHMLKEYKLVEAQLQKGTPILLDDARLPGGGKARLLKEYLREQGATCVLDEYQSLWTK